MGQKLHLAADEDGFKKLAFSPRMKKLMEKVRATPTARSATLEEAKIVMAEARTVLSDLMNDTVLERLLNHNPDLIQIVTGAGVPEGKTVFNGAIPLTEAGAAAIVAGQFNGANPDIRHVARADERPVAIYAALIYTPSAFGPAMKALTHYVGRIAPHGCPMFSRAVTEHTRRLFPALGFVPAQSFYPGAPDDLLVVLPEAATVQAPAVSTNPAGSAAQPITIRVARNLEDLMQVVSIRAATYMSEQECPYGEEFDGNDLHASHFIGEIDGEPAACLRVRYFADFVKFERLAVRAEFRKSRLAFRIVRQAIEHCRCKGYTHVYGHARADLVRFWGTFGFRPISDRPGFTFSGQPYVEMEGAIAPHPKPVSGAGDPFRIIRPEGEWDMPGPLDHSAARAVEQHIYARQRRIGERHPDGHPQGRPHCGAICPP